jgi:pyruvate ferredoxin oxidoreductase beta subunit
MNTGVQRSGTTPKGALTANTPILGKMEEKKDVPAIMAAHGLSYMATASAAYPLDLYDKIIKAKGFSGVKYIHIHTPCPPGWGFDPSLGVRVGRLAVESGAFDLYEIEASQFRLTGASKKILEKRHLVPVKDYLSLQGRFKGMDPEAVSQLQQRIDSKWEKYFGASDKE